MRHVIAQILERSNRRILQGTSYCEECGGGPCTTDCRQDGLIDRQRRAALERPRGMI